MTAAPLPDRPTLPSWPALAVLVAIFVQLAGVVAYGAKVQAEVADLQETTKPLKTGRGALTTRIDKLEETTEPIRRGDLVAIQTDVAWIRREMEKADDK
ncbi:MAG: hypothetical protein EBR82_20940 [Caulobacteraceae bacterium]|nr:hypothetical protein [Caulobacteraceae bacterium]